MTYDLFILGILLFTTWRGAAKGVAWQLAAIGAMVLCFLFATPLSLTVAPMIKLNPPLNRWAAMLAIYLVFCGATFLTARIFREFLEKAKFQEFDRHLGGVFGLIKGVVIGIVLTFFVVTISPNAREQILKTYSGFASAHIMNALDPVMPAELHAILEPYIHQLDDVDPQLAADRRERHNHLGDDHDEHDDPDDPFFRDEDTIPRGDSSTSGSGYRPTTSNNGQPTTTGSRDLDEETIQEVLANLPRNLDAQSRRQVERALRQNTHKPDRLRLIDELKSALPQAIQGIAQAWQDGPPVEQDDVLPTRPRTTTRPPVRNVNLDREGQQYLRDIARIYSDETGEQNRLIDEIQKDLEGLPNDLQLGVLADWWADLRGVDNDPDPETNVTTRLTERVYRQRAQLRIADRDLSPDWQQRLNELRQR